MTSGFNSSFASLSDALPALIERDDLIWIEVGETVVVKLLHLMVSCRWCGGRGSGGHFCCGMAKGIMVVVVVLSIKP